MSPPSAVEQVTWCLAGLCVFNIINLIYQYASRTGVAVYSVTKKGLGKINKQTNIELSWMGAYKNAP